MYKINGRYRLSRTIIVSHSSNTHLHSIGKKNHSLKVLNYLLLSLTEQIYFLLGIFKGLDFWGVGSSISELYNRCMCVKILYIFLILKVFSLLLSGKEYYKKRILCRQRLQLCPTSSFLK